MQPRPAPPASATAPNAGPAGARSRVARGLPRAALPLALAFVAACSPSSVPRAASAAATPAAATIDPRYSQPVPDLDQLQPNQNPQAPFEIAIAQRVDRLSQALAQQGQALERLAKQLDALPKPIADLQQRLAAAERQAAANERDLDTLNQEFSVYGRGFHSLPTPTPGANP